MAQRRESVRLDLEDNFSSGMARAAASTALLNAELDRLNGTSARVRTSTSSTSSNITNISRSSNEAGGSINQLTGRLGLLADAALILGPGLVPIGAVGVQALGGLTAAATAAAVAAGSAVVAFQGIGEAAKAVQEFQDSPTWDNARAAHEELDKLAPAARKFVMEFQQVRPLLDGIQDSAANGWFPGLTDALENLDTLAPKLEDILFKTGQMGGTLVDQGADSLAGPRWDDFFQFISDEVPTAMASLARTMGDLTHGASEMFMSFDPGNDAFLGWLEDVADGFDRWASSADGQDSIQSLLEYARQNGPAVAELFNSLVGALAAIVEAAAPLGGPVLTGLTAVADVIKAIADSDLATPLLGAIAAMRIYTRVAALAAAAQARVTTNIRSTAAAASAPSISAAAYNRAGAVGQSVNSFGTYSAVRGQGDYGTYLAGRLNAPRDSDVRAQAAAERRARFGQTAAVGAGAIGAGLLASGAADDLNVTNAAMGALIGTMAGPWGAALGASAGFALDAAKANNELEDSIESAVAAFASGDLASGLQALQKTREEQSKFTDDVTVGMFDFDVTPGDALASWKNDIEGWFGSSDVEEGQRALDDLEEKARTAQEAAAGLGEAFGMSVGPLDGSTRSVEELNAALEAAKPAMDALGVSQEQLVRAKGAQDAIDAGGLSLAGLGADWGGASTTPFDDLTDAIRDQQTHMDSAAGKAENYQAVLRTLSTAEFTAAEKGDALREAISALVDPALDAESALSTQRDVLKDISELNADGMFTVKNEVGRENLATTRAYTEAVKERLATMVAAKRPEEDVAEALGRARDQFIKSGIAAGFSANQMRRRADAIGLTPKLVETTFRAINLTEFDKQVRQFRQMLEGMPKRVQTALSTSGVPKSIAEANALADRLDLTAKERRALIRLAGVSQTQQQAFALGAALDRAARDRTSTITVRTNNIRTNRTERGQAPAGSADGGTVPKTGMPYADRHLYLLADGEEVISNRDGQADRHRALLKAINDNAFQGYAVGGTVGGGPGAQSSQGAMVAAAVVAAAVEAMGGRGRDADDTGRALRRLQRELDKSTTALSNEQQQRRSLIDTIRTNFTNDPFAESSDIWSAASGDPNASLSGDIADLKKFQSLTRRLSKRGLDGNALAEADTLDEAKLLAGMSRPELRQYERLFNQRARLASTVGGTYANAAGAKSSDIRELQNEVKRLRKDVKAAEKANDRAQERASNRNSEGQRATARAAAQRRRKKRD